MYRIRRNVLESIIGAARRVYPREFFSMLGGKNRIIEELVVVQADFGEDFSTYRPDLVPFDRSIIGTVHSHPTSDNQPSDADLDSFESFGEVHLIIGRPYNFNTLRAYSNTGRVVKLGVIG